MQPAYDVIGSRVFKKDNPLLDGIIIGFYKSNLHGLGYVVETEGGHLLFGKADTFGFSKVGKTLTLVTSKL